MGENLKELLRKTFSADTEAGYRLRYHITRALMCIDYSSRISFDMRATTVGSIFIWSYTIEGVVYWYNIDDMVDERFPSS